MSLHKSFGKNTNLGDKKNVFSRIERIKILKERGLWQIGDKVTGLPKEKILKLKKVKIEKEETKEKTVDWEAIKKK